MHEVIIDGTKYVPAAEIEPMEEGALKRALQELTAIQYFNDETGKHRAWAWNALSALAPDLVKMDAKEAYDFVRME